MQLQWCNNSNVLLFDVQSHGHSTPFWNTHHAMRDMVQIDDAMHTCTSSVDDPELESRLQEVSSEFRLSHQVAASTEQMERLLSSTVLGMSSVWWRCCKVTGMGFNWDLRFLLMLLLVASRVTSVGVPLRRLPTDLATKSPAGPVALGFSWRILALMLGTQFA